MPNGIGFLSITTICLGLTFNKSFRLQDYQIIIEDEHGHLTAAWLTPWLKDNLHAQDAERGDLIALTFLGKRQSPLGRTYNAYSLIVEKTAE